MAVVVQNWYRTCRTAVRLCHNLDGCFLFKQIFGGRLDIVWQLKDKCHILTTWNRRFPF